MIQPKDVALKFLAFFVSAKQGKTGLTVTCDVYDESENLIVNAGSATEIGNGWYKYVLNASANDAYGEYKGTFKTADSTVDAQHIPSLWIVPSWVGNLDAAISTRATPAQVNTEADAALADVGLTSTVTGRIDVAVSSRPSSATIADAVLDEALSGHVAAGSAGEALGLIDEIKARTDTIEVGDVSIASPFDPSSNRLTLVRGDDYPADQLGAIPPFTSSDWPDLTGATEIRLTVRERPIPPDTEDPVLFTLTDTTASRVDGAGEQSVTFEPLSAPGDPVLHGQVGGTADLIPGRARGKWDIQATLADGTVKTLALGLVDVLEDQTRGA